MKIKKPPLYGSIITILFVLVLVLSTLLQCTPNPPLPDFTLEEVVQWTAEKSGEEGWAAPSILLDYPSRVVITFPSPSYLTIIMIRNISTNEREIPKWVVGTIFTGQPDYQDRMDLYRKELVEIYEKQLKTWRNSDEFKPVH